MPPLLYAFALLPGLLAFGSHLVGGWSAWSVPLLVFGLIPVAEHLLGPGSGKPEDEAALRASKVPDAVLLGAVPLQYATVLALMAGVSTGNLSGWELPGAVLATGIASVSYGINAAHELGHRSTQPHRNAARALLLSTLYMHFFIEHNRGHHARVATEEDPASARRGGGLYTFLFRSITGSWRSAWGLEDRRLSALPRPRLSLRNEMTRFALIQLGAVLLALWVFGPLATLCWIGASALGIVFLETVNYVEHYGLHRERLPNGRYERVLPHHSWNSNHPIGRALLFQVTRHSDHHAHPARPYPVLRHFEDVPQLPTGYPGMVLLAFVPPVFRRVMERQLAHESQRLAQPAAAAAR